MSKVKVVGPASGTGVVTIAAPNTNTDRVLTLPNETGTLMSTANSFGFRNRIINGDMRIDQRNAGASVAVGNNTYSVDRFYATTTGGSLSMQQVSDAPSGFNRSWRITVSTALTVVADTYCIASQIVEGNNVSDFKYGTSDAATLTLSFWVKSSVTGSFGLSFNNAANTRTYASSYTINAANTWEYKTITIPGDTTGAWNSDNQRGISIRWALAGGSNYVAPSLNTWQTTTNGFAGYSGQTQLATVNGATWQITGVQLEKGDMATAFEFRSIQQELVLCQRYYRVNPVTLGSVISNGSSGLCIFTIPFDTPMRAAATVTRLNDSAALDRPYVATYNITGIDGAGVNANGASLAIQTGQSFTGGEPMQLVSNRIAFSAEL